MWTRLSLPVGAIELHGPHLPLSMDWYQGEIVARQVAKRLDAYLLPGMPFRVLTGPSWLPWHDFPRP